ncbi:hypothetical protein [Pseudomonas brassicacearum]|uniref:hypothetical protein n=1 Tax=Pseudomonas brassicacearum TaxID=930166 RepID=UPI0011F3EEDE|nr:hypothetical protein [Pseudomonas brassicacearum]QEO78863.1 hypothetical protein ELZ14_15310 [Pseudomonas brassicacearum]
MSTDILDAVNKLWALQHLGPGGLWKEPAFDELRKACTAKYQQGKVTFGLTFALDHALKSLGLPCLSSSSRQTNPLDPTQAASMLEAAFTQKMIRRRYLCPLDLAEQIPPISFGNARIAVLTAAELDVLFDRPRLARYYPNLDLNFDGFSQFQWLVVEEIVAIAEGASDRAVPVFSMLMNRDLGEIDPHKSRFPLAVEKALFFLLLAPWEEWAMMTEVDWRGFRIPWIYQLDDDLFVAPSTPRSPDSLSWEPYIYQDQWGEPEETERPVELRLTDAASELLAGLGYTQWQAFQTALDSKLFETPIMHFLVRGFLSDGIDEFMAHLTTVEAALGLQDDHDSSSRRNFTKMGATKRVARRLAAALNDADAAEVYDELFNLRSAFIHGRGGMNKISTSQRVQARRIASKACAALVDLAGQPGFSRHEILDDLLDKGVKLVGMQQPKQHST